MGRRLIWLFAIVFFLFTLLVAEASDKPKVLLIESYHLEHEWDINFRKGIVSVLGDRVEMEVFAMDTKRLKSDMYQVRADLAWQKYLDYKPDIVMLADDNALNLLASRFIKTETPVVYLGINNNPRNYAPLNKNITGVLERPLYKRTVKYLKDLLHMEVGSILIMLDLGTTSLNFKSTVFKGKDSIAVSGVRADLRIVSSYEEWKHLIINSKRYGYSAVLLGLYQRIFEDGVHVPSDEVMGWTSEHTPLPLFAFWEMTVGKGKAIGGLVLSGEVQGRAAAHMVEDILRGVPVNEMTPIIPPQGDFVFSRHELQRWKIILPQKIKDQARFVD